MTKDITINSAKESLEKLKLFSNINIWLTIILSIIALIAITTLSGGKGYGAYILFIIASPLAVILPYYLFTSFLIGHKLHESGTSKGYLCFLRILVLVPWFFIIIALIVINS